MALRRVAVSALSALALLAAGDRNFPLAQDTIACGGFYEVAPGDTLRDIAVTAYGVGNYQLIFNANRQVLERPSLLLVGQRLFIPCPDGAGPRTGSEATRNDGEPRPPVGTALPDRAEAPDSRQSPAGREIVPVPLPSRIAEGRGGEVSGAAPEPDARPGTQLEEPAEQPGNPPQRRVRSTEVVPRPPREGDPRREPPQVAQAPVQEATTPRRAAQSASATPAAADFQPARSDSGRSAARTPPGGAAATGPETEEAAAQSPEQAAVSTPAARGETGDTFGLPSDDEHARETARRQNAARAAATSTEGGRVRPVPAIPRLPQQVFETATLGTTRESPARERVREAPGEAPADGAGTGSARQTGDAAASGQDRLEKASDPGTEPAEAPARPERVFGLPEGAGPVSARTPQALARGPAPVEPLPSSLPLAESETGQAEEEAAELALVAPTARAPDAAPASPELMAPQAGGDAAAAPRPIRLLTGDYPPYTGADLPQKGMLADIVAQALRRAAPDRPHRISFVDDWALHLSVLLPDGAYDLGLPWFKPDCTRLAQLDADMRRRCTDFLWSQPLHEVVIGYFVRAGDPLVEVQDHAALAGQRICRPAGQHAFDLAEKGLAGDAATLVRAANPGACVDMLVADEVDVVALGVTVTEGVLAEQSLSGQVAEIPALADILTLHVIAPRDNPRSRVNLALIDRGLRAMRSEGVWFEVIARHLADYSPPVR